MQCKLGKPLTDITKVTISMIKKSENGIENTKLFVSIICSAKVFVGFPPITYLLINSNYIMLFMLIFTTLLLGQSLKVLCVSIFYPNALFYNTIREAVDHSVAKIEKIALTIQILLELSETLLYSSLHRGLTEIFKLSKEYTLEKVFPLIFLTIY